MKRVAVKFNQPDQIIDFVRIMNRYEYDADVKFPADICRSTEWEMTEEGEEQTYFSLCYTPEVYVRKQIK